MHNYEWLDEYLLAKPGMVKNVDLGGSLSDDQLRQMCDDSYRLVFGKLAKKLQREILERAVGPAAYSSTLTADRWWTRRFR